jgi:P27 family predicted phage terminase small subunit
MPAGRKVLSDNEKRMKGTDQPCRMNYIDDNIIPAISKLPSPAGLGSTGKKIFKSTGTILMNTGKLNELNLQTLFLYCREYEIYFDIMAKMPTVEEMIHNVYDKQLNHTTQVTALRKIANEALSNCQRLGSELGLTPSSQAKIFKNLNSKPKNPLESYFNELG